MLATPDVAVVRSICKPCAADRHLSAISNSRQRPDGMSGSSRSSAAAHRPARKASLRIRTLSAPGQKVCGIPAVTAGRFYRPWKRSRREPGSTGCIRGSLFGSPTHTTTGDRERSSEHWRRTPSRQNAKAQIEPPPEGNHAQLGTTTLDSCRRHTGTRWPPRRDAAQRKCPRSSACDRHTTGPRHVG